MTGNVTLKPLTSFLDCPKTYIRTSYSATVAQVPQPSSSPFSETPEDYII